ncbi:predicted protein [Chaetoceros tenuissimus]|uniref:Uncharacterized protein n=1 Tax=Chaetoceros tenuissimus TaxID=426638 RepID=A0AAD3CR30_9STRA|nr:predicted protein [Chaetoceros tenuissimus]
MEECSRLSPGNVIPDAHKKKIAYNAMHEKYQKYLEARSKLTISDFISWDEMQKVFIKCQRAHAEEEKKAKQDAQKEKGTTTTTKRKKPDDDEKVECQHCRYELNVTDPKKYNHHYNDCYHRKKQKQQHGGKGDDFKLVKATDFFYLKYTNVNDSKNLITLDSQDTKPVTLFKIRKKDGTFSKPLLALLDTGAGSTVGKATLSTFGKVSKVSESSFSTANGRFSSNKEVKLDFVLSEFSESRIICPRGIRLLPDACDLPYDLIIGRNLMHELKMDILFSENEVLWDLPMHSTKTAISET